MITKESPGSFIVSCDFCVLSHWVVQADDIPAVVRDMSDKGWKIKPDEHCCPECR